MRGQGEEKVLIKYNIYVGLSDPNTHIQLFSTDEYIYLLKEVCRSYRVAFSFDVIQGGYIYDDGTYVDELSLHISLFDLPEYKVNYIAEDLCTFFNQESVMVTRSEAEVYYVRADREVYDIVNSALNESV